MHDITSEECQVSVFHSLHGSGGGGDAVSGVVSAVSDGVNASSAPIGAAKDVRGEEAPAASHIHSHKYTHT